MTKFVAALLVLVSCAPVWARCWSGEAVSWYAGRSGPSGLPGCASREHPKGSVLSVTLPDGRSAECEVNDHGPAPWTKCKVDVDRRAAAKLGILTRGVAPAEVRRVR